MRAYYLLSDNAAAQNQKVVAAWFSSKQLQHFGFAEQISDCWWRGCRHNKPITVHEIYAQILIS